MTYTAWRELSKSGAGQGRDGEDELHDEGEGEWSRVRELSTTRRKGVEY
jgi:hypothetical protein